MILTWSDSEKEEELDYDDEFKNFTAFMTSAIKAIETSSKASNTKKSDESDGSIGFLEEKFDEDDKSKLQRAYDQLYKQSYKLDNANVKLGFDCKSLVIV